MFKSIPKAESVHEITLARAIELLAEKRAAGGGGRLLGAHPDDNRSVSVYSGRYGPYVKYGKVNATIPRRSILTRSRWTKRWNCFRPRPPRPQNPEGNPRNRQSPQSRPSLRSRPRLRNRKTQTHETRQTGSTAEIRRRKEKTDHHQG
jgi:hypothetical protein